jgi:hypothetical protein
MAMGSEPSPLLPGEPRPDAPGSSSALPEDLDDALHHLARNLVLLSDFLERHAAELSVAELARLSGVLGQNLARFGCMCQDRMAAEGELTQGLQEDVLETLRLAGKQLEMDL